MCNCNIKFNFRQVGSNTEMQAVCCGCKGPWSVMPSSGGGAGLYLPLAGGVMNNKASVKFPNIGPFTAESNISDKGLNVINNLRVSNYIAGGFNFTLAGQTTFFDYVGGNSSTQTVKIFGLNGSLLVNGGTINTNLSISYPAGIAAILVDASAGPVTITLPNVSPGAGTPDGMFAVVKKLDASANAVTITASVGQVEGASNISLTTQGEAVQLVMNVNSDWFII